ncbi:hypothetical protein JKF63_05006 [Porcisia hertigi]|uniref:Matrin-type domain-containing protein n=1 Tax=Porcisia hertigi TaxID=2761500 RepID=A0A836LB21_9TRYP|nr:hypothetical protein JKF63_05006 [Porcisia hertigi]
MDPSTATAPSTTAGINQRYHQNGNGDDAFSAGQPSEAEMKRIRQRRRLAKKTPEQRRKLQQYQRRHNEKDERLYYCDYCDLFISSRHKTWMTHLRSARHIDAFQSYYDLVAHVENVWVAEINREVELARSREVHRLQHKIAGEGSATPLMAQHIAPGIVVGGAPAPGHLPPPLPFPLRPQDTAQVCQTTTIRVGTKTLLPLVASALSSPSTNEGGSKKEPE